jgi:hypothetical protein
MATFGLILLLDLKELRCVKRDARLLPLDPKDNVDDDPIGQDVRTNAIMDFSNFHGS